MDTPECFPTIFRKGNTFSDSMFASMEDKGFPTCGLLLKVRICSCWSKFFPLKDEPFGGRKQI